MADIIVRFNSFRKIEKNTNKPNMSYLSPNPFSYIYFSKKVHQSTLVRNNTTYYVFMKGYLSNYKDLIVELQTRGYSEINNIADCVLCSYFEWNEQCVHHLEGAFSFVVLYENQLYVARDSFGQVPLYVYRKHDGEWIFSDEISEILNEGVRPIFSEHQFMDLMVFGPSLIDENTLFKNIQLLEAGTYLKINNHYSYKRKYYSLEAHDFNKSYDETKHEIQNIFTKYMNDNFDNESAILLSGGLDSSIVAGVASNCGFNYKTYSVTYENAQADFNTNNIFQPSLDNDFIKEVADYLHVDNQFITLSQELLADALDDAMILREHPGMADIDSSLLLLLKGVNGKCSKIFTGECADEIFGGYPWFTRKQLQLRNTFPWLNHLNYKIGLLNERFQKLDYYKYRENTYNNILSNINTLETDINEMRIKRKMMYLSINHFMPTLVNRMAMMNKHFIADVYLPFANKKLVELAYNMPCEYYRYGGHEKGILRDAFTDVLPYSVKIRKKSPYPKTYSDIYNQKVNKLLENEIKNNQLLTYYFNEEQLRKLMDDDLDIPFYGQLMCGPQLKGYLYQFSKWLEYYNVIIE
ncbi:MAG: hypothetical protein IKM20_06690 [Erysipelotrichales bacterium]|nr:hypothetical protein [Erysipelotrichales bacterium]